MNIENGAIPATNDTTVPAAASEQSIEQETAEEGDSSQIEDGQTEGEDQDGQQTEPEAVEVEHDGKKFKVPSALKDAFLRQADYTRKTQEVAETRKAVEAERAAVVQTFEKRQALIQDYAKVVAINDQLAQYNAVDWDALQVQDPDRANQLWRQREQLKERRDQAANSYTMKVRERDLKEQQGTATRLEKATAELPKLIPDWSPELNTKLAGYGTAQGLSKKELFDATLQNPKFVALLHKAYLYDQSKAKKATVQQIEATQAVRPAPVVRSNASTATKDPAKMGDAEYRAWRAKGGGERKKG